MKPTEIIGTVDGDPGLIDMLWFHSATHTTVNGMPFSTKTCMIDREMWSALDARGQIRREQGWAAVEWRLVRALVVGNGALRVDDIQFRRLPYIERTRRPKHDNRRLDADDTAAPAASATAMAALALSLVRQEYNFAWEETTDVALSGRGRGFQRKLRGAVSPL